MECSHCKQMFTSKNQLFKHLPVHGVTTNASASLKVSVLVGWIADEHIDSDAHVKDGTLNSRWADDIEPVEDVFWRAVDKIEPINYVEVPGQRRKGFTRASSCEARASYAFGLEKSCHAVGDVFCFNLFRNTEIPTMPLLLDSLNAHLPPNVRVLHMQELPKNFIAKFHAEQSCSQRVFEYVLPRHLLLPPCTAAEEEEAAANPELIASCAETKYACLSLRTPGEHQKYHKLKQIFKAFITAQRSRQNVHNFVVGGALPDEPITSRKIDRISIREVMTLSEISGDTRCLSERTSTSESEWVTVSISADALLAGQARKMVGLVVAVVQGYLSMDYMRAALSDEIVDVPAAPGANLYLTECRYAKLEAGSESNLFRLDPRRVQRAGRDGDEGSNLELDAALNAIESWRRTVHRSVIKRYQQVYPADDWLNALERHCGNLVAKRAALLRTTQALSTDVSCVSVFSAITDCGGSVEEVRAQYAEVLRLLREADVSGDWPANSVGRQKVIFHEEVESESESSAPTVPGGSFTVGVLPLPLAVPNGNRLFPELLKACFLLEQKLCPNRPPSSTIAINRHAQFRPHRDNGAGNGQTLSLIVGLGDYCGGHCVVEGVAHDIRYRPLEFDGWNSRHWTMPFTGERYSLVWFTPMGVRIPEDLWWLDSMDPTTQ